MPGQRREGMDHPHYSYSPMPARERLRWPDGAAVALGVVVLVEHVELDPPPGSTQVALIGGIAGAGPSPNVGFLSQREYGHRVGIFRVLDALGHCGVPASIAIDAMAAERNPFVVDRCLERGAEIVAHGVSASRVVTSAMSEEQERDYVTEARDRIEAATGRRATGWYGPEQSESERTPQLLDALGFDYVCDWPNDDQPYLMDTPRSLVAVPTTYMLDDVSSVWGRSTPPSFYTEAVTRSFATLAREGAESGRSMVLVVRPWLTGQPFRIAAFEQALEQLTGSGAAWAATTNEIASAARDLLAGPASPATPRVA